MKKITVTLDDQTAARFKVEATERNMSLSRYICEVLRAQMQSSDNYEKALQAWLAEKPLPLKGPRQKYPKREDLYDRPMLRRR